MTRKIDRIEVITSVQRRRRWPASGDYQDFMTGFVLLDSTVWGRPVNVAVAADGELPVTDDASGSIWRIAPGPK